eukprot:Blabericola_migrator_1__12817@NODE_827_length_6365_cov_67_528739_g584_i0_p1_GENE_NODE_827_length_6365_cov_67_528739_g584_i0NODE_827_length_6365_cov_67_528739_g584_i0_p1_ORF_typecomplete_len384_score62_38DUF2786/PF10979_8/0_14_NODE_827_length_6365_cov_67_528739_g584_i015132664
MSPRSLRLPARNINLKYVGLGALCAILNNPSIGGSQIDPNQTEENAVKDSDGDIAGENTIPLTLRDVWPAAKDRVCPPSKDSLAAAFVLHVSAILESMPPCPLEKELSKFMQADWPDIEQLLDGRQSNFTKAVKTQWKAVEFTMGDADDILLQEGALLLSLVMGKTDPLFELNLNVEALTVYIRDGLCDPSLPLEVKSLLRAFECKLIQCRSEVFAILHIFNLEGEQRKIALRKKRVELFVQLQHLVKNIPPGHFQNWFERQGFKCLISLRECQLPPLHTPEIEVFSRSLRAIAGNVADMNFAGMLFQTIHATLEKADKSPTPEVASLFAAQCNDLIARYERFLSCEVLAILKLQGEAVLKHIFDANQKSRGPDLSLAESTQS